MLANGHSYPAARQKFPPRARWWFKWLFLTVAIGTAAAVIGIGSLLR